MNYKVLDSAVGGSPVQRTLEKQNRGTAEMQGTPDGRAPKEGEGKGRPKLQCGKDSTSAFTPKSLLAIPRQT